MKKIIALILSLACMQLIYAADAANIKIRLSGPTHHNSYFLCIPNIGCLSIDAANKGKIYPVLHDFAMNPIYITDINSYHAYSQGLPSSCDLTVQQNQTITISGKLVVQSGGIRVNNLRCAIK